MRTQPVCKHGTRLTLKCYECEAEGASLRDRLNIGNGFAASEAGKYVDLTMPPEFATKPGFYENGARIVPEWDHYHMTMARVAATRSKDRSTQIGCIIVGPDHYPRATGYNNFPAGIDDNVPARHERPEKYFWTEHAERNAIYFAAKHGVALEGCTLYCTWVPCMDCGRAIVQTGIRAVFGYAMRLNDPKWKADFERVTKLFEEAGVTFRIFPTLDEITLRLP